jgi:diacylglycerol kinase (ATP)
MLRRHIVVAINPHAAFGRNRSSGDSVVSALREAGYDVTALREKDFADLVRVTQLAIHGQPTPGEAPPSPADALVVVGGDGMVSLGVNLIAETRIPLAIVPSGTGNDLARGLGIPVGDLAASIRHLLSSLTEPAHAIDLGRITCAEKVTYFACILSAGFDAIVNERANKMTWPKGKSRYTVALLLELVGLKAVQYSLTVDGISSTVGANLISIANNTSMGGGMLVTPDASLTDGLLDVFVLRPVSRLRFLRLFPRVFAGTHVGEPEVHITQGKRIRLEAKGIVSYADGERVGPLPIDVEVVPAAVQILSKRGVLD